MCIGILTAVSSNAYAIAISGQGTWETTLQARTFDGTTIGGYYDTALNITWLANANYFSYLIPGGAPNWGQADFFVTNLNLNGITGWRLPITADTGIPGCNLGINYLGNDCGYNSPTATSELAHMYYVTLGNKAIVDTTGYSPQPGQGLTNTGPFSNLLPASYWSSQVPSDGRLAWNFSFYNGAQDNSSGNLSMPAWAVHPGDVGTAITPVPIPTALLLFSSGLLGLLGANQRSPRRAQ